VETLVETGEKGGEARAGCWWEMIWEDDWRCWERIRRKELNFAGGYRRAGSKVAGEKNTNDESSAMRKMHVSYLSVIFLFWVHLSINCRV
jgi:hypothetical protein